MTKNFEIGTEVTTADQIGRTMVAASIIFDGQVIGAITATPSGADVAFCARGVTVSPGYGERARSTVERRAAFISSGGAQSFAAEPTAAEVAQAALDGEAYIDGLGWAKYAARGSVVPAGTSPAFLEGARACFARMGRRGIRNGRLTGEAQGSGN